MSHLRPDHTPEFLNRGGSAFLPGYMGVEVVSVTQGRLLARMVLQPHHIAPNGFLHAASVIALADTACGYGTMAHMPDGTNFTTIELKSNFLGTARQGVIACEARAEHLGRTTHVWDAVVTDESNGRRIALFRCTQMLLKSP
jgi:1,4-dihydroxy-2-naphthoyl-CoA hydrolase